MEKKNQASANRVKPEATKTIRPEYTLALGSNLAAGPRKRGSIGRREGNSRNGLIEKEADDIRRKSLLKMGDREAWTAKGKKGEWHR